MVFFTLADDKLTTISEIPFKLERDLQRIVEQNTKAIFGFDFVTTEFELSGLRIDTLGFDRESNAFVIIEYKKDKNLSVIDQGYAYLSLMLNNKADFVLAYNENKGQALKKDDTDWSQSRVIFVAPEFSTYQRQATDFKDLPIELWEVKKYANNTIQFNQIQSKEQRESITKLSSKNDLVRKVSKEIKIYTEDYHLEKANNDIKKLYGDLKKQVTSTFANVSIKPKKKYIAFLHNTNFIDIIIQKSNLKIIVNLKKGILDDPREITRDISQLGHYGNGDYEITVNDAKDLEYIMSLIDQSYANN